MNSTPSHDLLQRWQSMFDGHLKGNNITFNNEIGKGEFDCYSFQQQILTIRINVSLSQTLEIKRTANEGTSSFVTFLFGDPLDANLINEDSEKKDQYTFNSLGIFCLYTEDTLKWTFHKGKNKKFIMVRMHKDLFDEYIQKSDILQKKYKDEKDFFIFEPITPKLKEIFNNFFKPKTDDFFTENLVEAYSRYTLSLFFRRIHDREKLQLENQFNFNTAPLYKAKEILEKNTHQPISIDLLTKECGMSESRLRVLFKKAFGVTIHQYHQDIRLALSQDMLLKGDKSLSMIAMDLGYSSGSHFSMVFKKQFNISPKEFKSNNSQKNI